MAISPLERKGLVQTYGQPAAEQIESLQLGIPLHKKNIETMEAIIADADSGSRFVKTLLKTAFTGGGLIGSVVAIGAGLALGNAPMFIFGMVMLQLEFVGLKVFMSCTPPVLDPNQRDNFSYNPPATRWVVAPPEDYHSLRRAIHFFFPMLEERETIASEYMQDQETALRHKKQALSGLLALQEEGAEVVKQQSDVNYLAQLAVVAR